MKSIAVLVLLLCSFGFTQTASPDNLHTLPQAQEVKKPEDRKPPTPDPDAPIDRAKDSTPPKPALALTEEEERAAITLEVEAFQAEEAEHESELYLTVQIAKANQKMYWSQLFAKHHWGPSVFICDGSSRNPQPAVCKGTPRGRLVPKSLETDKK